MSHILLTKVPPEPPEVMRWVGKSCGYHVVVERKHLTGYVWIEIRALVDGTLGPLRVTVSGHHADELTAFAQVAGVVLTDLADGLRQLGIVQLRDPVPDS